VVQQEPSAPHCAQSPTVSRINGQKLLISNKLATPTVMLRRRLPFRFDERKRYSEDYLLWLEIILSGHVGHFIEADLAYTYKADYGEAGLSSKLWSMERGELQTLSIVRRKNLISRTQWTWSTTLSLIKFLRRVALTQLRRLSI